MLFSFLIIILISFMYCFRDSIFNHDCHGLQATEWFGHIKITTERITIFSQEFWSIVDVPDPLASSGDALWSSVVWRLLKVNWRLPSSTHRGTETGKTAFAVQTVSCAGCGPLVNLGIDHFLRYWSGEWPTRSGWLKPLWPCLHPSIRSNRFQGVVHFH